MGGPITLKPVEFIVSLFLFYSLYTSMVTKNKFFTFPARLTPSGSRSRIEARTPERRRETRFDGAMKVICLLIFFSIYAHTLVKNTREKL